MGIYGSAHTGLDSKDNTNSIACMANQLNKHYPNFIYSENISWVAREIDPIRTDVINAGGKDYQALYFGQQDLNGFKDYAYREYWILQDSYDDFKDSKKTMDWLPESNYIMTVGEKQVFVIDYIKLDGSTSRSYYIFDGKIKDGEKITNEIIIK